MVSRAMELQTAKVILAEVFHARPGEVQEMIKSRLEESWPFASERVSWLSYTRRCAEALAVKVQFEAENFPLASDMEIGNLVKYVSGDHNVPVLLNYGKNLIRL
jgi:hypothetical protein